MIRIQVLAVIAFLSAGFRMGAQEGLTITQCYELARNNYPLIRQHDLINKTEQYNLDNAAKGWLPQIAVNARATYQSEVTKLPFDSERLQAVIPGFSIPTLGKGQYQATAELSQTVWDGGLIHAAREMTKAQATAERLQLESDLYALNERVNQLYFGCLLQDELIGQNSLLQKDLQVTIDRIAGMMENGVASLSDRESLEAELLNARQHEIELKAGRKAYGQLLGMMITPFDPSAGPRVAEEAYEELVLTVPSVLPAFSFEGWATGRPELEAFEAQSHLTDLQNRQITAGLMPRIGLFVQGGYGRPGLNMLEDSFEAFYVAGIRLSWNVGKLYTAANDRRKVATGRRAVGLRRDIFLFNTTLELMQQHTEIQKMTALLKAGDQIVRLRTSIRKAAEVKLQNGVISASDLVREINAEDRARQTVATNRIRQLMAIYNYMYTTNNKQDR
jgi:outer membrane protein TolC